MLKKLLQNRQNLKAGEIYSCIGIYFLKLASLYFFNGVRPLLLTYIYIYIYIYMTYSDENKKLLPRKKWAYVRLSQKKMHFCTMPHSLN